MYAPVLITPPAESIVTLDEAKAQLRVDHADDDVLIQRLIDSATSWLDGYDGVVGKALVSQTWRQDFDGFRGVMELPVFPVSSVTSITYYDTDGNLQTVAADVYALRRGRGCFYVELVAGESWPMNDGRSAGVSITFVAGYGAAADVPQEIRHAALMLVAHWYENREAVGGPISGRAGDPVNVPYGVKELLAPHKRTYIA